MQAVQIYSPVLGLGLIEATSRARARSAASAIPRSLDWASLKPDGGAQGVGQTYGYSPVLGLGLIEAPTMMILDGLLMTIPGPWTGPH